MRCTKLISAFMVAIVTLCGAPAATAQVTSLGTTTSGPMRPYQPGQMLLASASNSTVAYDDKHDVFLHVWEDEGTVVGRFIGFDGTPRGIAFTIAPTLSVRPVVVYSRGAADDVFCVLVSRYPSGTPFGVFPTSLAASFVRFTGTGATGGAFVGTPGTIVASETDGLKDRAADAVFNPHLRRFLLAWALPTGVAVQHFDGSGTPADGAIPIAKQPVGGSSTVIGIDLAYDWQRRTYVMSDVESALFPPSLHTVTSYAHVLNESKVQVGPSIVVGSTLNEMPGSDVTYLPESSGFLGSFGDGSGIQGRSIATDPPGAGASYTLVSGHNDRNATIDYDALSRRALVVDESRDTGPGGTTYAIGTALLDGLGQPVTGWTALRSSTTPFLSPYVSATTDGQFVVSYAAGTETGREAVLERVSLPLASPAGPRFSNVAGHVDGPVNGATVGSSFLFGGWALDFGASTGTGIDVIHAWAFPANGSAPIFLGDDQTFHARADLASLYGPHFSGSGFDVLVNGLVAGSYTLVAYGRSTVSGTFAQVGAVSVTVASQPFMSLDVPSHGATVGTAFSVGGWAIDLSAPIGGTGVDAIHVWAFNTNGAPPVFAGVADYGWVRPDVAAAFGSSQFTNSGYNLSITSLPAGTYDIAVYAHSAVSGSFNQARVVRVTVP